MLYSTYLLRCIHMGQLLLNSPLEFMHSSTLINLIMVHYGCFLVGLLLSCPWGAFIMRLPESCSGQAAPCWEVGAAWAPMVHPMVLYIAQCLASVVIMKLL